MSAATVIEPEPISLQLLQPLVLTPEAVPVIASIDSIITASNRSSTDHDAYPDGLGQNAISHAPQVQIPDTALVDHGNDPTFDEDSASNASMTQTQSSGSITEEQSSGSSSKWKRKTKKALCGTALANICAVLGLVAAAVWWVLGYKFSVWTARNDALQACYNAMHSLARSATTTFILAFIVVAWLWSRPRLRTPRRLCISMARGDYGIGTSGGDNFLQLTWSIVTVFAPPQEAAEAPIHCQPQGPHSGDAILVDEFIAQDPGAEIDDFDDDFGHLTGVTNLFTYSDESLSLSVAGEAAESYQEAESYSHIAEAVQDDLGDDLHQDLIHHGHSHGSVPIPPTSPNLSISTSDMHAANNKHAISNGSAKTLWPREQSIETRNAAMLTFPKKYSPYTEFFHKDLSWPFESVQSPLRKRLCKFWSKASKVGKSQSQPPK